MFGRDLGFFDDIISGVDPLCLGYFSQKEYEPFSYMEGEKRIYQINAPGIEAEDLNVLFDSGVVVVKGESKQRTVGLNFSFRVGKDLDKDSPTASLKNGVLNISFEKIKDSYKKIPVSVE